jgi:hypothetical protein
MTAKVNAPLQREVLLAHLRNFQAAIKEVSEMNLPQQKFLSSLFTECSTRSCGYEGHGKSRTEARIEDTDLDALLRARRERPRGRAAERA